MISHKHKCIFIHIPKTAGTSFSESLDLKKIDCYTHNSFGAIRNFLFDNSFNADDYFSFSLVRNPWDKMVSEYFWFTNTSHPYPNQSVKDFYAGTSFKSFVLKFFSCNVGDPYHKLSYLDILDPISKVDFIGKFENVEKDFNFICKKLGVSTPLPHKYKTKHKHYTEYYDDETREIVAEKYAKDIEHFGYKFGG